MLRTSEYIRSTTEDLPLRQHGWLQCRPVSRSELLKLDIFLADFPGLAAIMFEGVPFRLSTLCNFDHPQKETETEQ